MTRALVVAFAAPLLVAAVVAQQATFKAGVDLVSVDVLVTTGGKPVAGLAASDFEVLDNKVPQKIESISSEGAGTVALRPIPLDVVLVFDTSESVKGDKLTQLTDAAKAVLDILRPGDRAALVTFSHRTLVRHQLSSDIASIRRAVESLNASGRTALFDALYTGLSLRRTSDTRSMALLFSDGQDNSSWLNGKQILQVARESDTVVYAVGLDEGVKKDMQEIADATGGAVIVAQSAKDLNKLFARIVRDMQLRYVLNYYPNGVAKAGWHAIEVRVPGRRAEVVARRGYWRQ
jgi:Ca-activated chloride channel family protein